MYHLLTRQEDDVSESIFLRGQQSMVVLLVHSSHLFLTTLGLCSSNSFLTLSTSRFFPLPLDTFLQHTQVASSPILKSSPCHFSFQLPFSPPFHLSPTLYSHATGESGLHFLSPISSHSLLNFLKQTPPSMTPLKCQSRSSMVSLLPNPKANSQFHFTTFDTVENSFPRNNLFSPVSKNSLS